MSQRFTTLEPKDIGIRKSEFVAKTQFLLCFRINYDIPPPPKKGNMKIKSVMDANCCKISM